MTAETNAEYFARRAREERELSRTTADTRAAMAHAEMAERNGELAEQFITHRPSLHIMTL